MNKILAETCPLYIFYKNAKVSQQGFFGPAMRNREDNSNNTPDSGRRPETICDFSFVSFEWLLL